MGYFPVSSDIVSGPAAGFEDLFESEPLPRGDVYPELSLVSGPAASFEDLFESEFLPRGGDI